MIISHEDNTFPIRMEGPDVKNADMKVLIGEAEGWENHVMRIIELDEEGYSPKHEHPWPHINYVIEGEGTLYMEGIEHEIKAGSFSYVPADEMHQFRNTGKGKLRFICIVPTEGHM